MKQVVDSLELSNRSTAVLARYSSIDYRVELWKNGKLIKSEKVETRKEASKMYAELITSQVNKHDYIMSALIGSLLTVLIIIAIWLLAGI